MVTGQSTEEAKGWKSRKMKTSEGHRKAANPWLLMMWWFMAMLDMAAGGTNESDITPLAFDEFFLVWFLLFSCLWLTVCYYYILAPIPGRLCDESWRCWPWRQPPELKIYHWPLTFDEFFLVLFSVASNNKFWRQFLVDYAMSHGAAGHGGGRPNFRRYHWPLAFDEFFHVWFSINPKFQYILAPISLFDDSCRCWPWRRPAELRRYYTTRFWRVFFVWFSVVANTFWRAAVLYCTAAGRHVCVV